MPQKPSSTPLPVPLKRIVAAGGGHCNLALKLGITASAISQWRGRVPIHQAEAVARATGIRVAHIRPDVWGDKVLRSVAEAHRFKRTA